MDSLMNQLCSFDTAEEYTITPKPRKPAHSVSFADQVRVFDHWQADHFTPEERKNTWYSRSELHSIQLDAYYTTVRIEEANNGNPSAIANDCVRGLESKTPTGMKKRYRRRKEASLAVLDIQEEQRRYLMRGEHPNPEPIARAYAYAARESEERAYNIGLMDHQTAIADETKENVRHNTGKLQQTLYLLEVEREPLANVPPTPKNGIAVKA